MTARARSYDSYRRGWREAGRGNDVPLDRLAYAALVYVARQRSQGAHAGAEKLLWYLTANKVAAAFHRAARLYAGRRRGRT